MKKTFYSLLLTLTGYAAQAQLAAGTYTINNGAPTSGTNYTSFTDAVAAMSAGIAGPVTFNVAAGSGPYNEQVVVPAITGASATSRVIFNGNATTLAFSGITSARTTLKLDNADYITVNNLNINATSTTFGYALQLTNNADYNIINNCTINCAGTGLNSCGIAVNGNPTVSYIGNSFCDSNVISNNTINNGYYGITVIGDATSRISGNKVINNSLTNSYFTGIYVLGNNNMLLEGNDLSRSVLANLNSYYGIQLNSGNLNTIVSKNKVHNFFGGLSGSSAYSIYGFFTQSVATAGNENVFSNNIVYNMDGDGTQYGFYNTSAPYTSYYHNTVCSDNTASVSGNTYAFYQTGATGNIILRNNLFSITRGGTGTKACIYMNTAGTTFSANTNNYYINSVGGTNIIGRINGQNQATLSAWQSASLQDTLTVSILPLFSAASSGNLLPNSSGLDNLGQPVAGITTDIAGAVRSNTTPDIGAFEFSAPVISISGVTALCSGATATLTGTPAGGTWSASNTAVATINASGVVTAVAAGTATITYTTATGTATAPLTVTATPTVAAITGGASQLCVGSSTTFSNATPGGTWTSSNQFRATIDQLTGALNAVGPGAVTVTYSVANGSCVSNATAALNVGPNTPPIISGTTTFCEGSTTALTASTQGGTWASANTAVATVNATTGVVTGVSNGTVNITYTTTMGCTLTGNTFVTVNQAPPTPAPLTGNTTVCQGATTVLSSTTTGGLFTSSNALAATVDTYTGVVTGIASGTSIITYYVYASSGSGCSKTVSAVVTVAPAPPAPAAITGIDSVCEGNVITLSNTTTGGSWSSADTTIASIDAGTGVVTGKSAGTTTVSYTVTGGTCTNSAVKTLKILQVPVPVITAAGASLTTGSYPTYSWQINGSPIPGANSQSYTATANGDYSVVVTAENGCSGTSAVTSVRGVGIGNSPASAAIRLFPNPSKGLLYIEHTEALKIEIVTTDGRLVYEGNLDPADKKPVDLAATNNGLLIVRIFDAGGRLVKNEKLTIIR